MPPKPLFFEFPFGQEELWELQRKIEIAGRQKEMLEMHVLECASLQLNCEFYIKEK